MQPVRSATGEGAGEPPDARTDTGRPRPRGSTVAWLVVGGVSMRHLATLLANLRRFALGQPLRNVVDKAQWF